MADTAVAPLPGPAATPPPTSISPADTGGASAPAQAGSGMSDAFASLDKRGGDLQAIATAPTPKANPKVPTRAKPPEQKPIEKAPEKAAVVPEGDKPVDAPRPAEVTKPAETPKPGDAPTEKPKSGWQRYHEAEKQLKVLEAKLAEKEKVSAMPEDHPELVRLRGEIEKRENRMAEVENHLRYRDYEASTEYQEQYHKPYMQTATEATAKATQLRVSNEGTPRALTPEEFWKIVHTDDADAAITAAEQLFGEGSLKANFIIERRNEILLAHQKAEKAKADFRKNAAEITRKQQEEQTKQGTERSTLFKKLMADGIEKDPTLYKPEEGDNEGNVLLGKGFEFVDRVFSGGAPAKEGEAPMSAQEMIAAHAEIRNKAAAFDRVAHKYKALAARVQELETALEQYEASAPAKGEATNGDKGPAREDDMESILSGLDKRSQ